MKLGKIKRAFTLIELLVVITIIGILATGWVSVFTNQLQKARDGNRITDITNLKSALAQYSQDKWDYPSISAHFYSATPTTVTVDTYLAGLISDVKHNSTACGGATGGLPTKCVYIYRVWNDRNFTPNLAYEISTWFENSSNLAANTGKSFNGLDSWSDQSRYEVWDLSYKATATATAMTALDTTLAATAALTTTAVTTWPTPLGTKMYLTKTAAWVPAAYAAP